MTYAEELLVTEYGMAKELEAFIISGVPALKLKATIASGDTKLDELDDRVPLLT